MSFFRKVTIDRFVFIDSANQIKKFLLKTSPWPWKMGSFTKLLFVLNLGIPPLVSKPAAEVVWHNCLLCVRFLAKIPVTVLCLHTYSPQNKIEKRRYTCWYATLVGEKIVVVFWKLKSRWGKLWKTFARVNIIFLHRILLHSLDPLVCE